MVEKKISKILLGGLISCFIFGMNVSTNFAQNEITLWEEAIIYDYGDKVDFNGNIYEAKWWTQGNQPFDLDSYENPWKMIYSNGDDEVINKNSLDYAELLKNKDVDYIVKIIDEYKSINPDANNAQINEYLDEKILSGELLDVKNKNLLRSDYSKLLPQAVGDLGPTEKSVFNSNPVLGAYCLSAGKLAYTMTESYWTVEKTYGQHNNNADAFRHAYWNALMATDCGESYAKKFADAHEKDFPSDSAIDNEMDLYNNSIGRSMGNKLKYSGDFGTLFLANDVITSVKAGKMKRFWGADIGKKTSLVATNSVGLK